MIEKSVILQILEQIIDPELKRNIVELGFIGEVEIEEGKITVHFIPDTLNCPLLGQMTDSIKQSLKKLQGVQEVDVLLEKGGRAENFVQEGVFGGMQELNNIQKVIAVVSGKGGVGKSLVSGLLAVYLKKAGYRVGILDADITGPSIPKLFFAERPDPQYAPQAILPFKSKSGIEIMSVNLLLPDENKAVVWRGPMIGRTIQQFWTDTLWGDLDFLIIDLPPGTSDAPLTTMQSLPISGVILVTSPQDLAGLVVRKAADMVQQIGIPILGMIENMSFFKAPDTGVKYEVFGPSHTQATAQALQVPVLTRLPLDANIAILSDQGRIEECIVPEFETAVDWIEINTPECSPAKMPIQANKSH